VYVAFHLNGRFGQVKGELLHSQQQMLILNQKVYERHAAVAPANLLEQCARLLVQLSKQHVLHS
jgi:hypothetical protein